MNPNVYPIGWRWLNPLWWVWAWKEHCRRQSVRWRFIVAYCELCRDDIGPAERLAHARTMDECDAEMDLWGEPR